MSQAVSGFVLNVSESEFQRAVIERSHHVPVLVDFWASWCGPCRILGPVLERLAEEFKGAFILAKVDIEENSALAAQFTIRSIPHVMLFRDGDVVDQFMGAVPEAEVRAFLRRYCPSQADQWVAEGRQSAECGDLESATRAFEKALAVDSEHAGAHLGLARVAVLEGRVEMAEEHLAAIPPLAPEAIEAQHVRAALTFHRECQTIGGEAASRLRVAENPNDLDARYGLASCLAATGRYKEALDEFLTIVAKDKHYRDESARKAMLTIFGLIGERSELAEEYRTKLAWTLY